jgi:hypothetical protein
MEQEDPTLVNCLTLILEPSIILASTDILAPVWRELRTLRLDPRWTNCTTLKLPERRAVLVAEMEDPMRQNARTLIALPILAKLSTESESPRRA